MFYDYSLKGQDGKDVSMKDYAGKLVLLVNTATACGFTGQYEALENLYRKYKEKGFVIIDVPCNQFGEQAKGSDEEINTFCSLKFHTTFPRMHKSDVNGEHAPELFAFLKGEKGFEGFGKSPQGLMMAAMLKIQDKDYKIKSDIKWNFTKFLISKNGEVLARFEPTASMQKVEEAIIAELD